MCSNFFCHEVNRRTFSVWKFYWGLLLCQDISQICLLLIIFLLEAKTKSWWFKTSRRLLLIHQSGLVVCHITSWPLRGHTNTNCLILLDSLSPPPTGTLEFCDIENWANFFPKIAKLVEFTLEIEINPKHSPFSWPKKKHSLPQRGL